MFVKRKCDENILLSKVRLSDIPCIDGNQITAETSNDAGINKANELLAKIGNRITEGKKTVKEMEDAKIKRMMDFVYQNDVDNMIENLMNDELIA